ncbi:plasma protease C1 inhibitor [Dicentrarchus labrax]|uniref:Serpin peptidase inhibitor, clade G (C1 inhibitor), member 1 n=1 Tax=Dicentrarchus labrax TaxID=13489 RepID=A0A8C4IUI1_DICLA|nr:plasma protease C1 inhibitor [Dicentrarchus labrax]
MRLQALLCLLLQLFFELSSCTNLRVISGSTLELPCLSIQTEFTSTAITWTFNDNDISALPPGSTRVIKDGLYLSLSPVTAAHEGEYACMVKETDMDIIRKYSITVDASVPYTIRVTEGSTIHLPCHFPLSSQVSANALWSKETAAGMRTRLTLGDGSTDDNEKVEQLYPMDHDQSIILRNTVMEDAGLYICESAEGQKLSTVQITVEAAPTPVPYSCTNYTTAWEPCKDENSRTGEPMLQESMAEFSMKLYAYLRESQPSANLLFSPISISSVLSHLLLGARGTTRKAIETAVCVPHDFYCVHFQMKKLKEKLASSLQMASQIFYNPQLTLSPSFTNQSIQFYDVEPVRLLETSEESTRMINSWVSNKTNNRITNLVDSVSPGTQLILLNGVSFNGQWKVKFDPKPKKGHFSKLNGDVVKVPLLYHNKYMAVMSHVIELKSQVARFALSGDSSLYILLPRSNTVSDLQQLEERMTDTAVKQMIEQMKTVPPQPLEVTLPQIKLDVQPDMNVLLKKLGLSSLFESANLCGLYSEEQLVLDEARHRAFLALTEQGVEAGAVTTLSFSRSFPSFSALRPFVMLLWSDLANVPLFIGRVTDP